MKCPDCSGNNCFEVEPDDQPRVIEEVEDGQVHLEVEVECYDCGTIFMWDFWES